MNSKKPFVLLLACLAFVISFASGGFAAETSRGTGMLTGRVQNVATGKYLNNARITVEGTDLVAFTDESGVYRLPSVPAGTVKLEVFYTGLDAQQLALEIVPGQATERNVDLTSKARYGQPDGTVKLDRFVVSTDREVDGDAIAVNEQRFAANIKNVVAADAIGDVLDGNVGEFLKFMPGVTADYDTESGGTVASVAVRGFPTSMAIVSSDGLQMANTGNPTGSSRVFQFNQVSLNNVARLEVTKVPTPSTPADSMSGSINMVRKSSFERKDAQLRYSVGLTADNDELNLQRTPHLNDRKVFKVRPSANLDYTLPLSKNLGLVLTATSMNRYIHQELRTKTYNAAGTGTEASQASPYLQTYQVHFAPRLNSRNSAGIQLDWRPHRNGVFTFSAEAGRFESDRTSVDYSFNVGTNATPTPATGTRFSYGPNFSIGATGRGAVATATSASVFQTLDTLAGTVRYRFDNGAWRVETALGRSTSDGGYQDAKHGRFRQLGVAMNTPIRVSLAGNQGGMAPGVEIYNNANQRVDPFDPNNLTMTTAQSTPRYIRDEMVNAKLDVRRSLNLFPFPAALQLGALQREQVRDVRRETINLTYNGLDGNPATPESPAPYVVSHYRDQSDGLGFPDVPLISEYKVWQAYQANPNLFSKTTAQAVAEETYRINNSEWLKEAVTAAYVQAEAGLFRNRLKLMGGVRFEKTETSGRGVRYDPGAVFVRNAQGDFARNAAGARIRKPEAGAAGSLAELGLTRTERGQVAERSYDGYYPSLHLTYAARENLLVRGAYARTYGRPDFTNIVPNTTVNEADLDAETADPSLIRGRLDVRNTGLRPWTADNYDLSVEYYTDHGGLFSAGVFFKEISDFFGQAARIATASDVEALGLDPRYVGWELNTQFNLQGKARVRGAEFNLRHSLRPLGNWGRNVQVFVNGTKLELEGDQSAQFNGFIPESMNWGFSASWRKLEGTLKWNYRGQQRRGPVAAVNGYEYVAPRTTLDVSIDYRLRQTLSLYFNAQNVFRQIDTSMRYGPETPEYAKFWRSAAYGVQLSAGVKGSF